MSKCQKKRLIRTKDTMKATIIGNHLSNIILRRRTIGFGAALGWLLAAVSAAFGQSTIQFAASSYTVSEAAVSAPSPCSG
jgi:hypothetical protein